MGGFLPSEGTALRGIYDGLETCFWSSDQWLRQASSRMWKMLHCCETILPFVRGPPRLSLFQTASTAQLLLCVVILIPIPTPKSARPAYLSRPHGSACPLPYEGREKCRLVGHHTYISTVHNQAAASVFTDRPPPSPLLILEQCFGDVDIDVDTGRGPPAYLRRRVATAVGVGRATADRRGRPAWRAETCREGRSSKRWQRSTGGRRRRRALRSPPCTEERGGVYCCWRDSSLGARRRRTGRLQVIHTGDRSETRTDGVVLFFFVLCFMFFFRNYI